MILARLVKHEKMTLKTIVHLTAPFPQVTVLTDARMEIVQFNLQNETSAHLHQVPVLKYAMMGSKQVLLPPFPQVTVLTDARMVMSQFNLLNETSAPLHQVSVLRYALMGSKQVQLTTRLLMFIAKENATHCTKVP